jgi:hypothetical protein
MTKEAPMANNHGSDQVDAIARHLSAVRRGMFVETISQPTFQAPSGAA